jgi:hypothetical protein
MSELSAVLALLVGVAVRLAIPVLLTLLGVMLLRRLDAHWQQQAAEEAPRRIEKPACWDTKQCTPERRATCPGYASPLPCWQARRMANGYLREECFDCQVFRKAPVPA